MNRLRTWSSGCSGSDRRNDASGIVEFDDGLELGVDPAGLTALFNREDALLVDLSPSGDFEKGHIAGARNVQVSQFDPENKLLAKVRELPVVLACRSGTASSDAARRLAKAGFKKVYWLDGGVAAWQQANLPLVKGKA